jgi:hypothetical protein
MMKGRLFTSGIGVVLVAVLVGVLAVGISLASQGKEGPVDTVERFVSSMEQLDLDAIGEYVCQDHREELEDALEIGMDELSAVGVDLDELLGVVQIEFKDMRYEEKSNDGTRAVVRVTGEMALDLDVGRLSSFAKEAASAAGHELQGWELDLAGEILDSLPRPEVSLDGDVELLKEDGMWVLCGEPEFLERPVVGFSDPFTGFDLDLSELDDLQTSAGSRRVIRGSGKVVTEERAASGFDRVSLTGAGDVIVTQGEAESLKVETDDNLMPYLKTEVQNGTLTLGFTDEARRGNVRPSKGIKFHLQLKELSGLELLGAGDIEAASLDADRLEILLAGAGNVDVAALKARVLVVHLNGAGNVELAGQVAEQEVVLSGAGDYRAGELESQVVKVRLNGAGDATVWASDTLDARIPGVGQVRYYGDPQVTKSVSLTGRLVSLGGR